MKLDWLKKNCTKIHYFGLGFIQIDVQDGTRFHFYTDSFPVTPAADEAHDHRYNFKSTILQGTLTQTLYVEREGEPTHTIATTACDGSEPTQARPMNLGFFASGIFREGEYYYLQCDWLHTVSAPRGTITMVERGPRTKELASVVYKGTQKPVCPFSIKVGEADLWAEVESILNEFRPSS